MSFTLPKNLETDLDALIARYPQPRSAAVMVLHALQDHIGFLSADAIEWSASRLGVQPIQILELVTFYPMFRQHPVGRFHLKLCRTLSCALSGSHALHQHLCQKLGLDPHGHGPQTTADGAFTVEFVECLASCATGPVLLCNDQFHEKVTVEKADALLAECVQGEPSPGEGK
jgi:NADH-quinone oxidoreductase subunit E